MMLATDIYSDILTKKIPSDAKVTIKLLGNPLRNMSLTRIGQFLNVVNLNVDYEFAKCEHTIDIIGDFIRYIEENSHYTDTPPVYTGECVEPTYDSSRFFATEEKGDNYCIWVKPIKIF
jgi:hypothetical protein